MNLAPSHRKNIGFCLLATAQLCLATTASTDPVQPAQVRERVKQIHQQLYGDGKDFTSATDAELLKVLSEMETLVWGYSDTSTSIEARRFRVHVCLYSNSGVAAPPKR